ncbi:MAG: hypothetical protein PHH83_03170 [Patescibacteria group bacterium]|nr:hypothetical protein [Patescibacteria group bacterium]
MNLLEALQKGVFKVFAIDDEFSYLQVLKYLLECLSISLSGEYFSCHEDLLECKEFDINSKSTLVICDLRWGEEDIGRNAGLKIYLELKKRNYQGIFVINTNSDKNEVEKLQKELDIDEDIPILSKRHGNIEKFLSSISIEI